MTKEVPAVPESEVPNVIPAQPDIAAPVNLDLNVMNRIAANRKDLQVLLDTEKASWTKREKALKAAIDQIDKALLQVMPNSGPDSTYRSTESGTLGTTVDTNFSVKDPAAYQAWVRSTGDLSLYTSAIGKRAVAAYYKQHNVLPPGVRAFHTRKITHNKTTS